MTLPRRITAPLALVLPLALLAACGPADDDIGAADTATAGLNVVASFYPLEYLAERIAGPHAQISTLTAPGVDPHDVELSARTVGALGSADVIIYASGMQPAVDQAVATQAAEQGLDVTQAVDLLGWEELSSPDAHAHHDDDHHDETHDHDSHDHEGDDHGAHDDHDHGPEDPHFWLDPQRYGQAAQVIADELAELDPAHATDYQDNVATLLDDLQGLDDEFTDGLASCSSRELITTHAAFGYLAHRYDLHQVGITGLVPDAEPSAARLAEVTALVEDLDVSTIYAEPILTSRIAETLARETGAQVLTLDPVEGITSASAADDYPGVMRANLAALRQGLNCA